MNKICFAVRLFFLMKTNLAALGTTIIQKERFHDSKHYTEAFSHHNLNESTDPNIVWDQDASRGSMCTGWLNRDIMNSGGGVSWWDNDLQFSLIHTFISDTHDAINTKGEEGMSVMLHRHTDVLSLNLSPR